MGCAALVTQCIWMEAFAHWVISPSHPSVCVNAPLCLSHSFTAYSSIRDRHIRPLCEKWRHPQNQRHITYRNTVRGGPSNGGHWQDAPKKFGEVRSLLTYLLTYFSSYASVQTDGKTDKHSRHNTSYPSTKEVSKVTTELSTRAVI